MTFELSFTDFAAATDYFTTLSFTTLPVKGARTLAAHGFNDNGQPITTFARQHLANRLTYTFTEMPRRA